MTQLLNISKPCVSIVMPTYNRAKYLPISIDSILQQSFQDFELIIVDGLSSDNSSEIISAFKDDRIIHIQQSNQGEYVATNLGIRASSGKFVTWVHSDDILPADSLAVRVNCMVKNQDVDLCHGDISTIDENGAVIGFYPAFDGTGIAAFEQYFKPVENRVREYPIHHTTVMFRREFISASGYWNERLPGVGDTEWLLRALKCGKIKKAPGILYLYRSHPNTRRIQDANNGLDINATLDYVKTLALNFRPQVHQRSNSNSNWLEDAHQD